MNLKEEMKTIMIDMDNVITNNNFTYFLEEFLDKKLDFNQAAAW